MLIAMIITIILGVHHDTTGRTTTQLEATVLAGIRQATATMIIGQDITTIDYLIGSLERE